VNRKMGLRHRFLPDRTDIHDHIIVRNARSEIDSGDSDKFCESHFKDMYDDILKISPSDVISKFNMKFSFDHYIDARTKTVNCDLLKKELVSMPVGKRMQYNYVGPYQLSDDKAVTAVDCATCQNRICDCECMRTRIEIDIYVLEMCTSIYNHFNGI
jgi:hypothetical protein